MGGAINPFVRDGLELISARYAIQAERAVLDRVDAIYIFTAIMQVVIALATAILYGSAPNRLGHPLRAGWQVVSIVPHAVLDAVPGMRERVKLELGMTDEGAGKDSIDPQTAGR